jgi:hypothetical protein
LSSSLNEYLILILTFFITEQIAKRGESVVAFKPIVTKIIQDIQERLIFVAQTFIRDRIANYEPNSNDLDFPNKLLKGNFLKSFRVQNKKIK